MADHLFENQTITSEGLNLIAHATAANAIVYTKALSNATVPADPSIVSSYSGKVGTIASASSSGNAARITLEFGNSDTTSSQAVKCVALMGRLQSESGDGVIVAYCSSGESSITLPPSNDAPCVTRFVVNLVMSAGSDSTINVVESGVASLSDLSRFVSLHVAGDPTTGVNQTILGDKTWEHQQDFNEACRFHDAVVTHGVFPETDNVYSLGLQNARYKALYGETVNSTNVMTSTISVDEASVGSLHISVQDGDSVVELSGSTLTGWKSGYGTSDNPYQYKLLIGGGLSVPSGDDYGVLTITPQSVHVDASTGNVTYPYVEVKVGTTAYPLKSVCTQELVLRSTADNNSVSLMYGEGGIMMHADIMPAHDTRATAEDCGRYQRPWNHVYVRDAITFVMDNTSEAQCITLYEDEGTLVLSNGHNLRLGNVWGQHGEIYGAPMGVSSERHTPSSLPNSSTHADAPTWDIEKGTIVMAMPCWATARSVFMSRKGAGDSITVTFPDVAKAPFQHGNSYDTDPEKGAWYIASWRFGSGNSPKSSFIPFSTLDSVNDRELFSYLPAGRYRLLNGVEECTGVEYSDYHPEGMCVLLQKIS